MLLAGALRITKDFSLIRLSSRTGAKAYARHRVRGINVPQTGAAAVTIEPIPDPRPASEGETDVVRMRTATATVTAPLRTPTVAELQGGEDTAVDAKTIDSGHAVSLFVFSCTMTGIALVLFLP